MVRGQYEEATILLGSRWWLESVRAMREGAAQTWWPRPIRTNLMRRRLQQILDGCSDALQQVAASFEWLQRRRWRVSWGGAAGSRVICVAGCEGGDDKVSRRWCAPDVEATNTAWLRRGHSSQSRQRTISQNSELGRSKTGACCGSQWSGRAQHADGRTSSLVSANERHHTFFFAHYSLSLSLSLSHDNLGHHHKPVDN